MKLPYKILVAIFIITIFATINLFLNNSGVSNNLEDSIQQAIIKEDSKHLHYKYLKLRQLSEKFELEPFEAEIIAKYWEVRSWLINNTHNLNAESYPILFNFTKNGYNLWGNGNSQKGARIVAQLLWRLQLIIQNLKMKGSKTPKIPNIFVGNLTDTWRDKFIYPKPEFCDPQLKTGAFEPKCNIIIKEPKKWDESGIDLIATFENRIPLSKKDLIPKNIPWYKFIMENPGYYSYQVVLEKTFPMQSIISWWTGSIYRRVHGRWVYYNSLIRSKPQDIDYSTGRKKMAAIFISNCKGKNNRLGYVKELQKYIDVDIYGKCGDKVCPGTDKDCFKMLREYYFYLAFENSNCRDYITEKFRTNALANDVVPVVLGAHPDDYQNQAPQNSFIHIQHFKSPQELAKYLKYIASNSKLYNSYFEWKGTGEMLNLHFLCNFCSMAHYALEYPVPKELIGSYDWKQDTRINSGTSTMCLNQDEWYW